MISESTGQRQEAELGLYEPIALALVQAFDRYAFVGNNPVRYTNPSGHLPTGEFDDDAFLPNTHYYEDWVPSTFYVNFDGEGWQFGEKSTIRKETNNVAIAFARDWNNYIRENYHTLSMNGVSLVDLLIKPIQAL